MVRSLYARQPASKRNRLRGQCQAILLGLGVLLVGAATVGALLLGGSSGLDEPTASPGSEGTTADGSRAPTQSPDSNVYVESKVPDGERTGDRELSETPASLGQLEGPPLEELIDFYQDLFALTDSQAGCLFDGLEARREEDSLEVLVDLFDRCQVSFSHLEIGR